MVVVECSANEMFDVGAANQTIPMLNAHRKWSGSKLVAVVGASAELVVVVVGAKAELVAVVGASAKLVAVVEAGGEWGLHARHELGARRGMGPELP